MATETDLGIWSDRYRNVLSEREIRRRATVRGEVADGLHEMPIGVACLQLELALEKVLLLTEQGVQVMISLIERALAHTLLVHTDPKAILGKGYSGAVRHATEMPTAITGLAGVGKSKILEALNKVLSGRSRVYLDSHHPSIELTDFVGRAVGTEKTPKGVLVDLATDPALKRANARNSEYKGRWTESDLIKECARKMYLTGTCLFGIDELQFLAHSGPATLLTRLLLGMCHIRAPWFFMSNFSLIDALLARPPEVRQRLLARPVVIVPDVPSSHDWLALIDEYNIVCAQILEFDLRERAVSLWSLSAGIKRKLVLLLVGAYRNASLQGRQKIRWSDVEAAYLSISYAASRDDVEALIAHAGQSVKLKAGLRCPLSVATLGDQFEAYTRTLKEARLAELARSAIHASANAQEREAIADLEQKGPATDDVEPGSAAKKGRRPVRTLDSLQAQGRRLRDRLRPNSRGAAHPRQ